MEFALLIIAILLIILLYVKKNTLKPNQNKGKNNAKSFKELVKKTFPKYKVIEKNQMIMICEINHRNEPDELVFIRTNSQKKNLRYSGRMLIIDYPYTPNAKEMKKDFGQHLN